MNPPPAGYERNWFGYAYFRPGELYRADKYFAAVLLRAAPNDIPKVSNTLADTGFENIKSIYPDIGYEPIVVEDTEPLLFIGWRVPQQSEGLERWGHLVFYLGARSGFVIVWTKEEEELLFDSLLWLRPYGK